MASDWSQVPISEVSSIYIGGTPSRSVPEYWGADIKWASARDVANCRFRYIRDTQESISTLGLKNSAAKVLDKDTILLTARGTVGAICMLAESMAFNQTCYGLVAKENADPTYLYYAIRASLNEINAISYGTVFNTITTSSFDALNIPLPPLVEQRTIAHILGTLDDGIELNRRMNQTLEAMAQTLFKSRFVDFDPFRHQGMQDSPLGPIPKGWGHISLGRFAGLDKGVSYKGKFLSDDGLPMINLGCFLGRGEFSSQNLKHYDGDYDDRHLVYPGDVVIANTDITQKREVLGSPALVPPSESYPSYLFTHHVYAMRFDTKHRHWKTYVFFALLQAAFRERATGFATGTTVLALPRDAVLDYQVVNPGDALIREFTEQIEPMLATKYANDKQSCTTALLRDALLPRLLSGEIRVKDAEKSIKEGIT